MLYKLHHSSKKHPLELFIIKSGQIMSKILLINANADKRVLRSKLCDFFQRLERLCYLLILTALLLFDRGMKNLNDIRLSVNNRPCQKLLPFLDDHNNCLIINTFGYELRWTIGAINGPSDISGQKFRKDIQGTRHILSSERILYDEMLNLLSNCHQLTFEMILIYKLDNSTPAPQHQVKLGDLESQSNKSLIFWDLVANAICSTFKGKTQLLKIDFLVI